MTKKVHKIINNLLLGTFFNYLVGELKQLILSEEPKELIMIIIRVKLYIINRR